MFRQIRRLGSRFCVQGRALASLLALSSVPAFAAKVQVLATTNILQSTLKQVLGPDVEVLALMGPGVDPHTYKAAASDLRKFRAADLVVFHGLRLEGKLTDVLNELIRRERALEVGAFAPAEQVLRSADGPDPHIWLDPELWVATIEGALPALRKALAAKGVKVESAPFESWKHDVLALVVEGRALMQKVPAKRRVLVTSHDAFSYFSRRFGLEVHPLLGVSTETEASLRRVSEITELVRARGVPAVFVESTISPALVRKVMEESGARIGGELYGDALGAPGTPGDNYVGMVRHDLRTIALALGASAP